MIFKREKNQINIQETSEKTEWTEKKNKIMIKKTGYRLDRTPIPLCRSLFTLYTVEPEDMEQKFCYMKRKNAIAYSNAIEEGGEILKIEGDKYVQFNKIASIDKYKNEEYLVYDFLMNVFKKARTKTITQSGDLSLACLNYAFTLVQSNRFNVDKILLHPYQYVDLIKLGQVNKGVSFGDMWGAKILVSEKFPEYSVYLLPPSEDLGILSIYEDNIVAMNILDIDSMASIMIASVS